MASQISLGSLAALLRLLTWTAAALVVGLPIIGWSGALGEAFDSLLLRQYPAGPGWMLAAGTLLLPFAILAGGMIRLSGFCARLARGAHFSRAAAQSLNQFGWATAIAALLIPATRFAVALAATAPLDWSEAASVALRLAPILAACVGALIGAIVVVFAAVLNQATAIAEENATFL